MVNRKRTTSQPTTKVKSLTEPPMKKVWDLSRIPLIVIMDEVKARGFSAVLTYVGTKK